MNDFGFIYKTTCIVNNSIYIGQRKIQGKKDDFYLGSGLILKRMITKYGISSFKREVIEFCSSQNELDEKEKYWIKIYKNNLNNRCINIAEGGQFGGSPLLNHPNKKEIYLKVSETQKMNGKHVGNKNMLGKIHSENSKKKMSIAKKGKEAKNKGIKYSDEIKHKMSLIAKEQYKNGRKPSNLGKPISDEMKLIYSKRAIGNQYAKGSIHPSRKKVVQIDEDFKILSIFDCSKDAATKLNINSPRKSIESNYKWRCGGYYWQYLERLTEHEIEIGYAKRN